MNLIWLETPTGALLSARSSGVSPDCLSNRSTSMPLRLARAKARRENTPPQSLTELLRFPAELAIGRAPATSATGGRIAFLKCGLAGLYGLERHPFRLPRLSL